MPEKSLEHAEVLEHVVKTRWTDKFEDDPVDVDPDDFLCESPTPSPAPSPASMATTRRTMRILNVRDRRCHHPERAAGIWFEPG
jgi:hypothetical protein